MTMEKRTSPRFPLVVGIDYAGEPSTVLDHTENLSGAGLFIRTERDFAVGDRVALVLSLPDLLEPAEVEVEIVRVRPGLDAGVAVRVPAERSADRQRLERFAQDAAVQAGWLRPSYRVLVVEDNPLVAGMYASAIRRLVARDAEGTLGAVAADIATDGNEAFARLLAQPPVDLVITYLYMPVMTGFELLERIRAEPRLRQLPVVLISSARAEDRERARRLGANAFLQKPASYVDIVGTVRAFLQAGQQPGAPMAARAVPRGGGTTTTQETRGVEPERVDPEAPAAGD